MTDEELIAELRDMARVDGCRASIAAADRIEALTAEYEEAMECNEAFFVDNEFLKKQVTALTAERDEMAMSCLSADGEAQRAWDAQKAAEAERDEALEDLSASQGYIADAIFALDKQKAAEAERDRLREAAIALRDDMMERAEFRMDTISGEQYRIVNAGNGAWMDFCAALKGDSQ